jgi:hypothetical protein
MPAGLGARNRRKMTARLQACCPVNNRDKQVLDILLT